LVSQNIGYTKGKEMKGVEWISNIKGLYKNFDSLFDFEWYGQYLGKDVQIIAGGNSYKCDEDLFKPVFPNITKENIVVIPGAGHWVPAEKPEETITAISNFLYNLDHTL